jgi:hypothetical protein
MIRSEIKWLYRLTCHASSRLSITAHRWRRQQATLVANKGKVATSCTDLAIHRPAGLARAWRKSRIVIDDGPGINIAATWVDAPATATIDDEIAAPTTPQQPQEQRSH